MAIDAAMMNKKSWTIHPAKEYWQEYENAWDQLNAKLYDSHPFLDSRFIGPALKYFADDNTFLAVQKTDTGIEGMLLIKRINPIKWSSFLPSQFQISPSLFSDPGQIRSLIHDLPGYVVMLDILAQDPLYSPYVEISSLASSQISPFITFPHANTISVSAQQDFSSYWNSRTRKLRQNISRYLNRLKKNNISYQLNIVERQDQLPSAFERYADLESSGWKSGAGTAISTANTQGKYYNEVINRFARKNNSRIYELWFEDDLAASRIILTNSDIAIAVKTTYNEKLKKFSPGRVLLYLTLEHLLSEKSTRKQIEFYTNATKDQLSWADASRWIQHVSAFRNETIRSVYELSLKLRESS